MPRQGLGHSSVDIYNMVTPGTDDPVWRNKTSGQLMMGYQQTRSNFVLFSQDATDTEAWSKTNTAIDSTLYEAPDNSTTANAIKSNSTGEKAYNITQTSLSVTAGKTYTLSVHLKKENLGFGQVKFADGSVDYTSHFNLTTGAVTNAANLISTSVDEMDDNWFRCSITFQAQNTSNGNAICIAQSAAGDSTPNVAVSGIVLLYVWGWQLEENSEMSAYIVTTNSARTTTETLNDTSETWDFDSADLMPEADPDDDGVWEIPDNIVLNGDYEELGSELVTNGTFDADSNWTLQSSWSISGGKASYDAVVSGHYLKQTLSSISAGKTVKIQFDISDVAAGKTAFLKLEVSGTPETVFTYTHFSAGTYTFYHKLTSGLDRLNFVPATSSTGGAFSIDNISVKQVDPNTRWTLGTGWSIEDGKAKGAAGTQSNLTTANNPLTVGDTVEITYTISDYVAGSAKAFFGGGLAGTARTSNGTFTEINVVTTNGSFLIQKSADGNLSIDNVTVKEYAITPLDV